MGEGIARVGEPQALPSDQCRIARPAPKISVGSTRNGVSFSGKWPRRPSRIWHIHQRHKDIQGDQLNHSDGGSMKRKSVLPRPGEKSIASYVKRNAPKVKKTLRHRHKMSESVREAEYKGHRIVVRTRYEIRVDGGLVSGHLAVTNDGQVHYHPVPNVSFASAIDLVKQLIDVFPDDFAGNMQGEEGHEGHQHRTKLRSRSRSTRRRVRKIHG
jgi:hypothetical protein